MIPVVPIMVGTTAALDLLKKAKEWFYPDKTINEAEAILRKRMADDVGSLQEQLRDHRQVIDKLVEQVKADKDMIQKHNEVLIQLSERAQQAVVGVKRLRTLSYLAIGLAGFSAFAAIVFAGFQIESFGKNGRAKRREPFIPKFFQAPRV